MAAKQIMEEVKQKLKGATDELWYKSYTSQDYIRTYELLSAIDGKVVKNGAGDYSIEVFFDPELMSVRPSLHGWGSHAGFDNRDFREGLIQSIIHGMGGSSTNPRRGEATNVIAVVQEEATKYANGILKKYL